VSQRCPNCGRDLPPELGQHSVAPMTGLATCPHCGADVHIDKAAAREGLPDPAGEARGSPSDPDFEPPSPRGDSGAEEGAGSSETFSGHETMSGVVDEVRDKQK
jgi:hypothetical protein